jgi:hypothetical protein
MIYSSHQSVAIAALLPLLASFAVLAFGDASQTVWLVHLLAIFLACVLAVLGGLFVRSKAPVKLALAIIVFALLGIAATLLGGQIGPDRWVSVGPLNFYMAPFLLPSFIAACSVCVRKRGMHKVFAFIAVVGVCVLLALQPDASQALALLVGMAMVFLRCGVNAWSLGVMLAVMALITAWAFSRPDPLQPVSYVEDVFRLALAHSSYAGIAVIGCAVAFVALLWMYSFKRASWLAGVASYYAVLFVCSSAGLTPAPMVGFGAGPVLGFGLMLAVMRGMESEV